ESLALRQHQLSCFFFFFFQAEDGIRDFHVTGVQTCALPIFPELEVIREVLDRRVAGQSITAAEVIPPGGPIVVRDLTGEGFGPRSEERRVGKECRSRWAPDH